MQQGGVGPELEASRFEVHATPYGRPALDLLGDQIQKAKDGDPLTEVTVVVASNYAAVSTRRELAARSGGLAAVTFTTLGRVAERVGSSRLAAAGRRPLSGPVLAEAVRAVLGSAPGRFGPVAGHPATELALVSSLRELSGLTEGALDALAGGGDLAADVVGVFRRVRIMLEPEWYGEQDLLGAAAAAVDDGEARRRPIIVHLLQHPSVGEARLLKALSRAERVVVNVGLTGDPDADRPVIEAHLRAGIAVPRTAVARPVCSRIVSVSDPDEEIRAAIRVLTEWMSEGIPLGRMAVLYGPDRPYARLLHEHLEAAGLPHSGSPVRTLGEMFLGRTLRALLSLPTGGYRRADVMGLITGSGMLDGDRLVPGRAWEQISRDAGVVAGDDWAERLPGFADRRRLLAAEALREDSEARARHLHLEAERAEGLATFVARLRTDLEALEQTGSWRAMAEGLMELAERWLGGERRRWGWPPEEVQASERVEQTLERLSGLDALGGPPPGLEVFRRALDVELDLALGRVGRLGDGVLVAPVGAAVGVGTRCTVVVGLAEGSFPPARLDDSLLPDARRQMTGGELGLRAHRLHDDHRHLLAAVASTDRCVLVFPRGDLRRSADRPASRWLLADAAALAGRPAVTTEDLASMTAPWLSHVASFASGVASTAFPSTAQDLRLGSMLIDPTPIIGSDPVLGAGMALARARRSADFTRFDGRLPAGTDLLPDYTAGEVTSVTRLQEWARCPHAFFMYHLLGVEPVEEPERQLEMSPLERGSLVHEILERFIAEQIPSGACGPWTGERRERLEKIAHEVCESFEAQGLTGRGLFWRRDRARIVRDLVRFAAEDAGRPVRTEMGFDGVGYDLPDGRRVTFRGSVDRVDDLGHDRMRVLDYKTGSTRSYKGLSADDPHQGGRHLQLAVYAAAARHEFGCRHVDAYYWFTTDRGNFERIGYPVDRRVHDQVGSAVTTIVDGIRSGLFPRRPAANPAYHYVECWYCSPDGLSTAESRREWERKRTAPDLRDYLALVEPDGLDSRG